MATIDYKTDYHKRLRNSGFAKRLLKQAFEDSLDDGNWEAFGLLLQDIIEAQGKGKKLFAENVKISRQHLYRLFRKGANPTLKTLKPVLGRLGFRLTLEKTKEAA